MTTIKKYIPLSIRIIISFLFFLSAFAKLFPNPCFAITYFEVHQLEPMGIPLNIAYYLSRTLIGVEFAIGVLLLLPFKLKKLVIPATIAMLLVFILELSYEIIFKGNNGNCGCFGELIKMTPLEALLKNVLSVGLLVLYYFVDKPKSGVDEVAADKKQNIIEYLAVTVVILLSVLAIFMLGTCKCEKSAPAKPIEVAPEPVVVVQTPGDSAKTDVDVPTELPKGPQARKSGFEDIFADINKDKKILCFFAPSCDHCRATAKALNDLKLKSKDFPPIRVIFMDEAPEEIPAFFKFAGAENPHFVMDIITFWKKLGDNKDVPGVMYLWNGNVKAIYQGIDKEQFDVKDFKKELEKSK